MQLLYVCSLYVLSCPAEAIFCAAPPSERYLVLAFDGKVAHSHKMLVIKASVALSEHHAAILHTLPERCRETGVFTSVVGTVHLKDGDTGQLLADGVWEGLRLAGLDGLRILAVMVDSTSANVGEQKGAVACLQRMVHEHNGQDKKIILLECYCHKINNSIKVSTH